MRIWLIIFLLFPSLCFAEISVHLIGTNTKGKNLLEGEMSIKEGDVGPVTFTESLYDNFTEITPLVNPTFGADMNQNIAFSGSPEIIDDGAAGGWNTTAVQGAWNFSDGGKTSLTLGNDSDEALFEDTVSGTIDMSNFTAITGKVSLTTYNNTNNNIIIQFGLAGIDVGNSIELDDFIDTSDLTTEQNWVIPKSDLGLSSQTIDEMTITLIRAGGSKPTFNFDDIQIEQTGTPAIFVFIPENDVSLIDVQLTFVDNVTEANAKDYNSILGVTALANGINVQAVSEGNLVFSGSFSRLIDFLQLPTADFVVGGDATNSWVTINFDFRQYPVILKTGGIDGVSFTISDNLSDLILFRTFVRTIRKIK